MIVELRSVPECPNRASVRQALDAALADLGWPAQVTELVGDYPSPSVVVNGVDVMGGEAGVGAACRLDLPTAERIRAALERAMASEPAAPAEAAVPVVDRCAQLGDAIRADRARLAARLPDGLRQVHRAILRHFAVTGTVPTGAEINSVAEAAGLDPVTALPALAADDLVAVDGQGRLVAAYPFSPTPTPHVVSLAAVRVYAMCAIDALGMPFMLGTDAVITSTDPHSGERVQVTIADGVARFQPADTVVVYAATEATGRSVDTCCSTINFFTCADNATAWTTARPTLAATILTQDQAVALGRDIFEALLA